MSGINDDEDILCELPSLAANQMFSPESENTGLNIYDDGNEFGAVDEAGTPIQEDKDFPISSCDDGVYIDTGHKEDLMDLDDDDATKWKGRAEKAGQTGTKFYD